MLSKLFGKKENNLKGTLLFTNDGTCDCLQISTNLLNIFNEEFKEAEVENYKYNICAFYDYMEKLFENEMRFLEELTLGAYNNGRLILESNNRVSTMAKPLISFYTGIKNAELQQFALFNSTDAMKKMQHYQEKSEKIIRKNFQGHEIISLMDKREKLIDKRKKNAMSMLKNIDLTNLEGSLNAIMSGNGTDTNNIDEQIEELTSQINTMLSTM
jgi:hypothetical protein